ncbi:cytochrome P450 [Pilatotrama ljubarskyi]|nr:cytochrome P450 [Pilatotrama ljubarskyi]
MSGTTTAVFILLVAILAVHLILRKRQLGPLPPGPRGWPLVGNVFDMPRTYQWITFAQWGQRWGDIISVSLFGQPVVILNSSKHAVDILEKKSSIYSSRAPLPVAGDMIGWSRAMILAPYGDRLREMRKMLAQVLASRKGVERFHSLVEEETRHFLVGLRHQSDSLVKDLHKLAASIIIKVAYGYEVRGDDDPMVKTVDEALEDFSTSSAPGTFLADVFPFLRHIPSWVPGAQWKRKVAEQSNTFDQMADVPFQWVKEQMNAGTALPSFASSLLESNCDPEKEELIKMASASLYAGGADTTVSAISTFFLAMSCFPDVQRKAQAEVDAVIGHDRLPALQDRDKLPYLNALVLEVLRWLPVAPMAFPHQLVEDDFHEGYFLPKGTLVLPNIWKYLHDPQAYTDPMTFNPGRFIPSEGKEPERDPRDFCFGFGRRKCPGMAFAEASIFAACSMVLATFTIAKEARDGKVVEPSMEGTGALINHPSPFKCTLTVRSDKAQALLAAVADGIHSFV